MGPGTHPPWNPGAKGCQAHGLKGPKGRRIVRTIVGLSLLTTLSSLSCFLLPSKGVLIGEESTPAAQSTTTATGGDSGQSRRSSNWALDLSSEPGGYTNGIDLSGGDVGQGTAELHVARSVQSIPGVNSITDVKLPVPLVARRQGEGNTMASGDQISAVVGPIAELRAEGDKQTGELDSHMLRGAANEETTRDETGHGQQAGQARMLSQQIEREAQEFLGWNIAADPVQREEEETAANLPEGMNSEQNSSGSNLGGPGIEFPGIEVGGSASLEHPRLVSSEAIPSQGWASFFDRVVLVISFEAAVDAERDAALLQALYGRCFSKILFVAPKDMDVEGIPILAAGPRPYPDLAQGDSFMSYNYAFLGDVAKAYLNESIDGVLWIDSKSIINYWIFMQADKARVWLPPLTAEDTAQKRVWSVVHLRDAKDPQGRVEKEGIVSEEDWARTPAWQEMLQKARMSLEGSAKAQFQASMAELVQGLGLDQGEVDLREVLPRGPCSVFYIPSAHFPILPTLVAGLVTAEVPAEIAVPILCLAISSPSSHDNTLRSFVWVSKQDTRGQDIGARTMYAHKDSGIYPWPFHDSKMRHDVVGMMSQVDPSIEDPDL